MCGLAGVWYGSGTPRDWRCHVDAMTRALAHRGPDDKGIWADHAAGIVLGHRRLSILDLSPEGHQPMRSASGRFVIAFNGEIYNFGDLRAELEAAGIRFRGRSDTEVLLAAFDRWGVPESLQRAAGMFALAVWDQVDRVVHLARDRIGEKPLYYGWQGGTLLFGSELCALRAHPAWQGEVDRDALALYARHCYIPAPYSVFRGIRKVRPGTVVTIGAPDPRSIQEETYWSAARTVVAGRAVPWAGTDQDALEALEQLLARVVQQQMVSDVPLGAFLSGGIDSSIVVALMQMQSSQPVRTFTIGFPEGGFDEAASARAVARYLGTAHAELYVSEAELRTAVPEMNGVYDEPFADPSQLPMYLLARLARRHVTVSLSGDGGDELFAGYNHYARGARLWECLGPVPVELRRRVAHAAGAVSGRLGNARPVLRARSRRPAIAEQAMRLGRAAPLIGASTFQAMYRELMSHCRDPQAVLVAGESPPTLFSPNAGWPETSTLVERMMYCDLVTFLPDDVLVKVDRATMHVGLESRAPLIDHRVAEFAWRLPLRLKRRAGRGKWLLRRLLNRHVPPQLVDRPKHGFAVPIGSWLRGPLRSWAADLLAPSRLRRTGYFRPDAVANRWARHLGGEERHKGLLWAILMFEAWLDGVQR